jgi:hypothetical protein
LGEGLTLVELELQRGEGGVIEVAVGDLDGLFRLDDRVRFETPAPPRPKVAVIAPPGSTDRSLWALARVLVDEAQGELLESSAAATADLLLVEGGRFEEPLAKGRRYLIFGSRGLATAENEVAQPLLHDWDRSHLVTGGLDLSGLAVQRGLTVGVEPGPVVPLIQSDRGPLLVALAEPRTLWFRFTLAESNLGILPDFPRLCRRGLAYLFGAEHVQSPMVDGLQDLHESRIEPQPALAPGAPVAWRRPELHLGLWCVLAALGLWALRSWLTP